MRKTVIIIVLAALAGFAAWGFFGGIDRVTEGRVSAALVERGVPQETADCMAGRMVDRLSIGQLRKLEQAAPRAGETAIPLSTREAMARLRRIDDPEAVEMTVRAAASCTFGLPI